jgi:hypothetical protein
MTDVIGGPGRDRTDDLFHAMEARSQLRHRPTSVGYNSFILSAGRRFVKRQPDSSFLPAERKSGKRNALAAAAVSQLLYPEATVAKWHFP